MKEETQRLVKDNRFLNKTSVQQCKDTHADFCKIRRLESELKLVEPDKKKLEEQLRLTLQEKQTLANEKVCAVESMKKAQSTAQKLGEELKAALDDLKAALDDQKELEGKFEVCCHFLAPEFGDNFYESR